MKKKISNYLWIIPLIVGIVVGIVGIVMLKKAQNIYVPEMGESGWFDASTQQSQAKAGAIIMIVLGFGFLSFFGSIVTFSIARAVNSKEYQTMRELQKSYNSMSTEEAMDVRENIIKNLMSNKKKDEPTYCEYCGAMIKDGATSCDACGAKFKKK